MKIFLERPGFRDKFSKGSNYYSYRFTASRYWKIWRENKKYIFYLESRCQHAEVYRSFYDILSNLSSIFSMYKGIYAPNHSSLLGNIEKTHHSMLQLTIYLYFMGDVYRKVCNYC